MKVIESEENLLKFDNGLVVRGDGDEDCCAYNYLDFEQLPVGTEVPTADAIDFQRAITLKEDGFSLKDAEGTPKWVQARSSQNGYYSDITTLVLQYQGGNEITLGELRGDMGFE